MADNMINLAGNMPPELMAEQQQLNRQQRLADLLTQQGMQQMPAGSMVSGRYVATSPFQHLAQIANMAAGQYVGKKGDEQAANLAQRLRAQEMGDIEKFQQMNAGAPSQAGNLPLAGTNQAMGSIEEPMGQYQAPVAAIKPNPQAANLFAASSYSPALRAMGLKRLTEGPKWKEMTLVDPANGNKVAGLYDESNPNPRTTWTPFGTSSEAISRSDILTLRDRGIAVPQANMPNANAPMIGAPSMNAPVGNAPVVSGGQVNAGQPTIKPVSATNATSQDLIKTYGYDPFKPPPMPPMPSGEAARDWQKNVYKPIEGTEGSQVNGAKLYYNSLEKYNDYVSTLTASDLAKPSVRQMLTSLHATVKLTGKEANKLGVLNGGDERILDEVIPNYKDIFVTQENLKKMIQNQKEFASGVIVEAYNTQQKVIPESMRKYIAVPKVVEPKAPTSTPKQTGATAKAILNGEQIEVRNGKWVYSKTGKEVK